MKRASGRSFAASLLGILMTLVSAGVADQSATSSTGTREAAGGSERVRRATSRLLRQLQVADEGSRQGYRRDKFPHWSRQEDGCSTRQRVLIDEREEGDVTGCSIMNGQWLSIYDDEVVLEPEKLDIDHMVPLAEAWDSGAAGWSQDRRERFANDLGYDDALVAVTARSNRAKGDKDPAEWEPPDGDAWCRYATAWTSQEIRWQLTADEAEVDILRDMFSRCTTPPSTRIQLAS